MYFSPAGGVPWQGDRTTPEGMAKTAWAALTLPAIALYCNHIQDLICPVKFTGDEPGSQCCSKEGHHGDGT